MKCFYFSSSFSKKLTAIPTILLITVTTIAVTVSGESYCSSTGPGAYGACTDDYANCVANVLAQLRDTTPYTEHKAFNAYYPADQQPGAVSGFAACIERSDIVDCQSCLSDGIEWFGQSCASSGGAGYVGDICVMKYSQM